MDTQTSTEETKNKIDENLHFIMDAMVDGIFAFDAKNILTFVNPTGAKMLGYDEPEILHHSFETFFQHGQIDSPPYMYTESGVFTNLALGNSVSADDEIVWRKDGGFFHADYTSMPIWENGELSSTVFILRDISERKQSQAAMTEVMMCSLLLQQAAQTANFSTSVSDTFRNVRHIQSASAPRVLRKTS